MQIFLDQWDYRKFLFILSDVFETYQVECWNFCLMTTHYHLVLRNQQRNLSEAMRDLNGEYGFWWNATHRRVGHVFQGRYKDQIVQHDRYLLTLLRYVAMNPVRARMVETPADWVWGSYRCIAGLCSNPGFVRIEEVLRQFGDDNPAVLRERYIRHVLEQSDSEDADMEQFRSRALILGDRAFKRSIVGVPDPPRELARSPRATPVAIDA